MTEESLVFHELKPGRVDSIPVRNPWSEVRVLGFLRGDAYVNPFHDLLYALSRSSRAGNDRAERGRRYVRFTEKELIVSTPGEADLIFPYASLDTLHLKYGQFVAGGGTAYNAAGVYFLELLVSGAVGRAELRLKATTKHYRRLLDMLYGKRVRFREFMNGLRSFKQEAAIPYRRIQEIKAEYGVEW